MPLPDEVRELLQDLRLIRRRVLLATKRTELLELVIRVEPQYAEGDHLVKGCRGKTVDRRVPNQLRIGNGFDVEDEKRSGHRPKLAEKP